MEASDFQPGDVVYLQGGGVSMTVNHVSEKFVEVVWTDDFGEPHEWELNPNALFLVQRDEVEGS